MVEAVVAVAGTMVWVAAIVVVHQVVKDPEIPVLTRFMEILACHVCRVCHVTPNHHQGVKVHASLQIVLTTAMEGPGWREAAQEGHVILRHSAVRDQDQALEQGAI